MIFRTSMPVVSSTLVSASTAQSGSAANVRCDPRSGTRSGPAVSNSSTPPGTSASYARLNQFSRPRSSLAESKGVITTLDSHLTLAFQPRRLMIASAADGGKRLLDGIAETSRPTNGKIDHRDSRRAATSGLGAILANVFRADFALAVRKAFQS